MPSLAHPLARLRRSVLGAWLAVVYALAVLAAGLLPAPVLAMPAGFGGMVLCSGVAAPGDEAPAPTGELQHCKGCPASPVIAAPPVAVAPTLHRFATDLALAPMPQAPSFVGIRFGLPRSRAPPRA